MRAVVPKSIAGAVAAVLLAAPLLLAPPASASIPIGLSPSPRPSPVAATADPYVTADGTLLPPPWWHGPCDGAANGGYPGSYPLGASWDGLVACGPGPNEGGADHLVSFSPGAWGEEEWECVELSMRWMYLAWGVPPYAANGGTNVDDYAAEHTGGPPLVVVQNGTRGVAPEPGDVLELSDGGYGHTEVVTATHVNTEGDGKVRVITENLSSPTDGWYTLTVSDWYVEGGFDSVVDWLHNPSWSLEEPVVATVSRAGRLLVGAGPLAARTLVPAPKVAQAIVVGGGGTNPAPLLVIRTTRGSVMARPIEPGARWRVLPRSGVIAVAAASGELTGNERPVIGWLARGGTVDLQVGLGSRPAVVAHDAASIALGSDGPSAAPLAGYVTTGGIAMVRIGDGPWRRVASRVRELALAAAAHRLGQPLEAYVGIKGRAYVRTGTTGPFLEVGPHARGSVREIAVAETGSAGTPVVAYVTSSGRGWLRVGSGRFLAEGRHDRAIELAAGQDGHGYPLVALEWANRTWSATRAVPGARVTPEGSPAALSIGAFVVP
jgi:hypothetical protein